MPVGSILSDRNWTTERRAARRYPIVIEVEYKLLENGKTVDQGRGRTRNLSSCGILLESDRKLAVGSEIEAFLAWPARLGGRVNLTLWIQGRIMRAGDNCVAISIRKSDFRTRSSSHRKSTAFGRPLT